MTLSFVSLIDGGGPSFSQTDDGKYVIINANDLDKGRWLHEFQEPLTFGAKYKISGSVHTTAPLARVSLVWIANKPGEQIHSVEHAAEQSPGDATPIDYIATVPNQVKALRIELRGRSGSGLYEFQNIDIQEYQEDPPAGDEDEIQTISIIIGKTRWRITATEQSITFLKLDHKPLLLGQNKHHWID